MLTRRRSRVALNLYHSIPNSIIRLPSKYVVHFTVWSSYFRKEKSSAKPKRPLTQLDYSCQDSECLSQKENESKMVTVIQLGKNYTEFLKTFPVLSKLSTERKKTLWLHLGLYFLNNCLIVVLSKRWFYWFSYFDNVMASWKQAFTLTFKIRSVHCIVRSLLILNSSFIPPSWHFLFLWLLKKPKKI